MSGRSICLGYRVSVTHAEMYKTTHNRYKYGMNKKIPWRIILTRTVVFCVGTNK